MCLTSHVTRSSWGHLCVCYQVIGAKKTKQLKWHHFLFKPVRLWVWFLLLPFLSLSNFSYTSMVAQFTFSALNPTSSPPAHYMFLLMVGKEFQETFSGKYVVETTKRQKSSFWRKAQNWWRRGLLSTTHDGITVCSLLEVDSICMTFSQVEELLDC